ncbi:50S ribosomal protein L15 [candidate division GN15 bacterium]|nr:50S ribosomal protein L15 [candidate division GN15 bacterium]
MELHNLQPAPGSKKSRKRVGRGSGSGLGKTSGRGHKGAKARSGFTYRFASEGGQMPLHLRLPKFGFTNIFKKEFQVVNIGDVAARCEPGDVSTETLRQAGLIRKSNVPVKILGNGQIDKAYTITAAAFSKSAVSKIEAAGGKAEVTK